MAKKQGTLNSRSHWVIGVGASAGGLEALSLFVANLPPHFSGSVIIAQHLAPHSKSMMVELLSKQSVLPVVQALDGIDIQPGVVMIAPPNYDIDIIDDRVRLTVAEEAVRPKPSVDEFFESLAKNFGSRAVGIILSGTGSDGSRGIRAIKAAGGITLAQDDRSAKYDGMPKSAVETGSVDTILPPEQLASGLLQILFEHETRLRSGNIEESQLTQVIELIRERLDQDFRQYKPSTIQRRITKRMMTSGLTNFADYHKLLLKNAGELGELAKELLISVTSFFRDADVFNALSERLMARLEKQPVSQEFRVWVAGCATGEEAYSMAMMILDIQDRLQRSFPIKIFATDLDHDALQEARAGIYAGKDMASVPPRYQERYFMQRDANRFELIKRVRDVVVFARQDLIQNPPFVKLDLISCRNVMIYFEPELQRKVLEIFHYALAPSGTLVLGKSESILSTPQLFDLVDKKEKIFERRNVATTSVPMGRVARTRTPIDFPSARKQPAVDQLQTMAQRQLNAVFNVAGCVVDSEGTLVHVFGDVSPFLKFNATHGVNLKIAALLPKALGIEIPILLRKALKAGEVQQTRLHKIGKSDPTASFQIFIRGFGEDDEEQQKFKGRFFLVTFELKRARSSVVTDEQKLDDLTAERMHELEQELHLTREHLQTVIEELGVSNEELQSLNEELSSTNEEMQATNEELETTNEELQSSNEELTTVNEELTAKSAELRMLSVGLENIQNSIGSPLLVLDSKLRLRSYNTDALKVFYITPNDIGREVTSLSAVFEIPDLVEVANQTIDSGKASELTCETPDSNYQVRLLPSYDENRKIIGLIMVFIDNTQMIRTQGKLRSSESRIRAIVDASPTMISLKDNLGRYLVVNQAFMEFYGVPGDAAGVVGKTDREIFDETLANDMRDSDLEVFMKRTAVRREETIETKRGSRAVLATRFPIMDAMNRSPISIGTIALDITSQVQASRALTESESRYKAIVEDQAVFVCRYDRDGKLVFINETFRRYFLAYLKKEPHVFYDILEDGDRNRAVQVLNSLNPSQPVIQYEHKVRGSGNLPRWVRWIHRGIFDQHGHVVEFQSVGFDVTEYQKQAEQLRDREAVFAGIFSNTSDFITIFRRDGNELRLESLNRSAEHLLGPSVAQMLGRSLSEFFAPDQAEKALVRYQEAISSGKSAFFEEELTMAGQTRFFLTTIVPILGTSGTVERVAALSRDISAYKAITNDLTQAKEAAEVANQAKSDFLAAMSHELRTPLNVVLGLCQMLELSHLDDDQTNYVSGIHRSGRVLLTLIEDVLDISKIEEGKIKLESISFQLKDLVEDIGELFRSQADNKNLQLTVDFDDRAAQTVLGDPGRIRQVLVNFISNAIKFTASGSIKINVSLKEKSRSSGLYRFEVRDTGVGIKAENHHKIFQRFSQAETGHTRRFGGSGLGLAISKQLVNLMAGEVGFESRAGKGSTFWFELPLESTTRRPQNLTSSTSKQPVKQNFSLRVLAVDDNVESRKIICLFLAKLGHKCEAVDSGLQAIQTLKTRSFDIVLMDMQMPEMDGCETTRAIRSSVENQKQIPIVALTANALKEDVDRCLEAGMNDYLSKPLRLDDLGSMMNKWGAELEAHGSSSSKTH